MLAKAVSVDFWQQRWDLAIDPQPYLRLLQLKVARLAELAAKLSLVPDNSNSAHSPGMQIKSLSQVVCKEDIVAKPRRFRKTPQSPIQKISPKV